ncbi:MAG: hypothetical protein IJC28_04260, partial [Mailhella sp.]|nr:hypothetical protein [Mailhella sp.]
MLLLVLLVFSQAVFASEKKIVENCVPEQGGSIVMGSIGEPSNLIPYLSSDSASSQVTGLLYTSPLEYDKDFNIIKCAAEEWEVLEGGKFMRFRLKDGIKWQDGHPLTADDVTFTYKLMT